MRPLLVGVALLLSGCLRAPLLSECDGFGGPYPFDIVLENSAQPFQAAELVAKPRPTAGGCGQNPGNQVVPARGADRAAMVLPEWGYSELRLHFEGRTLRLGGDLGLHEPMTLRIDVGARSVLRNGLPFPLDRTEAVDGPHALRDFSHHSGLRPIHVPTPAQTLTVNSTWNDGLGFAFALDMVFRPGAPTQKYVPRGANLSVVLRAPNGTVAWEGYTDSFTGPAGHLPSLDIGTWRVEATTRPDDPRHEATHFHLDLSFSY